MTAIGEKAVFSRKEAAAYMGIHINTLDRSGVPNFSVGRRVLYRKATLDKHLEKMEHGGKRGAGRCGK